MQRSFFVKIKLPLLFYGSTDKVKLGDEFLMYELAIINFIVFCAAVLQAITGFGFAVIATPLLLLILNSSEAISISIFLSLFMSAIMLPPLWQKINWQLFKRLIIGSVLGAPFGLWLLMALPIETIKLFVASMLVFAVLNVFITKKTVLPAGRSKYLCEMATGFGAGILTASLGMPGSPLAMYFSKTNAPKDQVRSTALAFYVGVYIVSIILQSFAGQIASHAVVSFLYLLPAAFVGTFCGYRLFCKVNQRYFSILVNSIMLYTGIYMFWSIYS